MSGKCRACGAEAGIYVCHYCGTTVKTELNEKEEREALEELHAALAKPGVADGVVKNAFLPQHREVLIEAGLRMLPLLESAVAEDGAAGRLRAICLKLRLLGDDPVSVAAEKQLSEALTRYEKYDAAFGRWMIGCSSVALLALAAVTAYFLLR